MRLRRRDPSLCAGDEATLALEAEDLSQVCRCDRFCIMCVRAFCSHCCDHHDTRSGFHEVVPVDGVDADGHPVIPKNYPGSDEPISDMITGVISRAALGYTTPLPRDAFCLWCREAFSSAACRHHHLRCGPENVVRIEERAGVHCVRCTGRELWFPFVEPVLGDPVEDDDGEQMLLPLLKRRPGTCMQCGSHRLPCPTSLHCSARCARVVAQRRKRRNAHRRDRRDARRTARQLSKLHIHET